MGAKAVQDPKLFTIQPEVRYCKQLRGYQVPPAATAPLTNQIAVHCV